MTEIMRFFRSRVEIIGALAAAGLCVVMMLTLNYSCSPWVDEVMFTDVAANCVLRGEWTSNIYAYAYNPLHLQLLTVWLWIFGVSHISVCSFGCVLGWVLFMVLQRISVRRGLMASGWQVVLFAVMFWGSWQFGAIVRMGRIDILAAIFTALTVDSLIPDSNGMICFRHIFVYSFLMMLSAVYPIPVVVAFGLWQLAFANCWQERKRVFVAGLIAASGVFLAWLLSCAFYLYHMQLIKFVNSYFSFNATLSGGGDSIVIRFVHSYLYDVESLALYAVAIVVLICFGGLRRRVKWQNVAFVGIIPVLGVLAGRYTVYYSWMFALPVMLLFAWLLSQSCRRTIIVAICAMAVVPIAYCYMNMDVMLDNAHRTAEAQKIVDERCDEWTTGRQVMISEWRYYYPLRAYPVEIFVRPAMMAWDGKTTPRDKFCRFVEKRIESERLKTLAMRTFEKIEREYTYSPNVDYVEL